MRDRISSVLRPTDPQGESLLLERIRTATTDERQRETAFTEYVERRLTEDPTRASALSIALSEVQLVNVTSDVVHVHGHVEEGWPSHDTLTAMVGERAAQALEEMPRDDAIARLWAMQTAGQSEAAARRVALMQPGPAAELLSMMDEALAADLLAVMTPPHPEDLFVRIEPVRGAAIMEAMQPEPAVRRMNEIARIDSGWASLMLAQMDKGVAARLLAVMEASHAVAVFERTATDRANAVFAVMETGPAARRLAEMDQGRAAGLLSKMDKSTSIDLMHSIPDPLATGLLARMETTEAAEVLAKMEPTWACERLRDIRPVSRAVELLVALRPPRTLLNHVDGQLSAVLLREGVATLGRLADIQALLDKAQDEAARIVAKAEAEARQIRAEAEAEAQGGKPAIPTLADGILERLSRHGRHTIKKLVDSLKQPEAAVLAEARQLVSDGKIIMYRDRSNTEYYQMPG